MPLLDIRRGNAAPVIDLSLEEKDEEREKIEGCNQPEWKNTILSILYRFVPKDCKQQAERTTLVKSHRERDKGLPGTEIRDEGGTRERLGGENVNDYMEEGGYCEKCDNCG
jgi:hypothetical protein